MNTVLDIRMTIYIKWEDKLNKLQSIKAGKGHEYYKIQKYISYISLQHTLLSSSLDSDITISHFTECWEGRNFHLPFLVLQAGLRNKLTWERLIGENQTKV